MLSILRLSDDIYRIGFSKFHGSSKWPGSFASLTTSYLQSLWAADMLMLFEGYRLENFPFPRDG